MRVRPPARLPSTPQLPELPLSLAPSLWPQCGAAPPAPGSFLLLSGGSQRLRVTVWAPAWMDGALGSHRASWTEAGCITGCTDPRVGDRAQLLLASGIPLPRRHVSPRSGVPAATRLSAPVDPTRPWCVQAATSHSLVVLGPRLLHGHRVSGVVTDAPGRQDIGSPCDPRSALDP